MNHKSIKFKILRDDYNLFSKDARGDQLQLLPDRPAKNGNQPHNKTLTIF